jgi:hypothetical protein
MSNIISNNSESNDGNIRPVAEQLPSLYDSSNEEKRQYYRDNSMVNDLYRKSEYFKDNPNADYSIKFTVTNYPTYTRTEAFLCCGDETLCWLSGVEVDWLHDKRIFADGYDEHKVGFVFDMGKVSNV